MPIEYASRGFTRCKVTLCDIGFDYRFPGIFRKKYEYESHHNTSIIDPYASIRYSSYLYLICRYKGYHLNLCPGYFIERITLESFNNIYVFSGFVEKIKLGTKNLNRLSMNYGIKRYFDILVRSSGRVE